MGIERKITNSSEYKEHFSKKIKKNDKILNETLEQALKVRKFEIELYWKRATYFWAFIASSFAGYFVTMNSKNIEDFKPITIAVSIIGLLFSLGWYFVNRGSKYWQLNWETHVSMLENEKLGPLFKTVYNPKKSKFWKLAGEYPFSVSKVNQILSMTIIWVWVFILFYSVDFTFSIKMFDQYAIYINTGYFAFILLFAFIQFALNSVGSMAKKIKSDLKKEDKPDLITINIFE